MQDRVYGNPAGSTSGNGQPKVPANVPEDVVFEALYAERIVGYHPLVSRALKLSDAPKRLKDKHLERSVIYLSNLLYWTPRSSANGWVYKSVDEIKAETDLTRHSQDGARELLRAASVLEEKHKRDVYYRVGWGALKPLLRLAIQARHAERSQGDQDGHVQHGDQDGHVQHSSKMDMCSADEDGHVQQPSISTTQYSHPAQDQSSPAREDVPEPANLPGPVERPSTDDDRRQIRNGSLAGKSADADGDRDLKARIIREVSELAGDEVSAEANRIGTLVAKAVGREGTPGGYVSRLAELCILRDTIELLGEVAARSKGTEVKHPQRFLASCLASAIKDEEGLIEARPSRPGSSLERFEAAYTAEAAGSPRRASAAAPGQDNRDADGRRSLTGSASAPVYGVRNPELERKPEDYLRKGGVRRTGGGNLPPYRTAPDPPGATADARPQERGGSFSPEKLRRATGSPGSGSVG